MKRVLLFILLIMLAIIISGCAEQMSDEELDAALGELSEEELDVVFSEDKALVGQAGARFGAEKATLIRNARNGLKKTALTKAQKKELYGCIKKECVKTSDKVLQECITKCRLTLETLPAYDETKCTDTDDGINLNKKGITKGLMLMRDGTKKFTTKIDVCVNEKLTEYYCDRKDQVKSSVKSCSEGKVCENGECVEEVDAECVPEGEFILNIETEFCCPDLTAFECHPSQCDSTERVCQKEFHYCGDDSCDYSENEGNCPGDCSISDLFKLEKTNGPPGGIIRGALAISESNPNILYAGPRGNGIFKSTNYGATWQQLSNSPKDFISGRSLAVTSDDPNIVYLGNSQGVFKSEDGGESWELIHVINDVSSLTIDPNNNEIIYVGTGEGKLIKSINGGLNWQSKTIISGDFNYFISSIKVSNTNSNLVLIGTGYWDFDQNAKGVYKSENGGETWTEINAGLPIENNELIVNDLEIHPQDDSILYACLHNDKPFDIYRSDNGGASWEPFVDEDFGGCQSLGISNLDPNKMIVGQADYYVKRTENGGATWETINDKILRRIIIDVYFDPTDSDRAYITAYYNGIIKTEDAGISWSLSNEGLAAAPSYFLKTDNTQPNTLFAGSIDNALYKSVNGGETWNEVLDFRSVNENRGYIYSILQDPFDENVYYAGSGEINQDRPDGFFKSVDHGESWVEKGEGINEEEKINRNVYFMAGDENVEGRILLGTEYGYIYESTDKGESWNEITEDMTFTSPLTLVADPINPNHIYAGLLSRYPYGGGVFASFDSGDNWQQLQDTSKHIWDRIDSARYVYGMDINPTNNNILVAGDSTKPLIFKSTDKGTTWQKTLDLSSPDEYYPYGFKSIKFDPNNPNKVYAGLTGEKGAIYHSNNQGEDWNKLNEDLTFSTIHAITVDPNNEAIVYAAPWGGGLFMSNNNGGAWQKIETPTISIPAIIVDPENSDHLMIADRTKPKIYESFNAGGSWSELVALDEENYYRITTMALHNGKLYFNAFNKITGMISLFLNGPMSGTTFKLESGMPVEISNGIEGEIIIDFFSDNINLYSISHIYGVHKLEGSEWGDISPEVNMGFNNIISDGDNNLYISGASDIDMDLEFRIGNPNIVNDIYKSIDDGITWVPLLENNQFNSGIKKVLQHPTNNNVLFAATSTGLYVSIDQGNSWDLQDGLNFKNIGSMSVTNNNVYVGTLGGGVYVGKINSDFSVTWSATAGPYPEIYNIQLKVDPTNSNIIYATSFPGGVFKTTDGGLTWIESNFALPSFEVADPFTQGYYSLEINPNNPNVLYLGIFGKGVYKSNDGAATWIPMYGSMGQNKEIMKKGITQIKVDPTDSNKVYLATNEGVYFSDDGAESWEEINNELGMTDVVSLAINLDGNQLFAGTRGASVWKTSTTNINWEKTSGPITRPRLCWIKFDPTNSDIIYAGLNPTGIYKSVDGGITWVEKNVGLMEPVVYPIDINPSNPNEIYVGTGYNRDQNLDVIKGIGIFKSIDGGETWFDTSSNLPKPIIVNTINIDPLDHSTVIIGTEKGLFVSQNSGNTWSLVQPTNFNSIYALDFSSDFETIYFSTDDSVWKGIRK
jgi:photosystem II stability/assembly factor-like uncharacterized protein